VNHKDGKIIRDGLEADDVFPEGADSQQNVRDDIFGINIRQIPSVFCASRTPMLDSNGAGNFLHHVQFDVHPLAIV
jgi:hypothetical protein